MANDRIFLSGLIALLVVFSGDPLGHADADSHSGSEACPTPNVRTDVRPDPDGPPTKISVGLRLIDLIGIDDVSQTLTGDIAIQLTWTDPRLEDLAGCKIELADIWDPNLDFSNSGRLNGKLPEIVRIGSGGLVTYAQRFYGSLATYHNLRDFPFDKQLFRIWLMSLIHDETEVALTVDEAVTGRGPLFNITDWTILQVNGTVDRYYVEAYQRHHARFQFEIAGQRITEYYVWKVILPLCLIVAMSWAVFWIDPAQVGPQIGLSATSMLTLIAFIFATTNMLPELGYFTTLDLFIGASTILVFLALLQSITTTYLVSVGKAAPAALMDRVCRFAFPLAFASIVVTMFVF